MNAITRTTSSGNGGLIPSNVPEALELARMMATCGMLPEAFRDKPGNALMVVEQAMRWGLSPFAVAQETSVIQGKTFYSGKIMAAAVNNYGDTVGRLRYEYSGAGDERSVRVIGQIRGETEPREVTVKLRDARTQNKNWAAQPDQQLAYHGARVWGRRHLPEVMLGAYAPEELAEDERPEKPVQSVQTRPALEPTSLRDMRPKPVPSRAEVDRILGGDDIPALAHEPKPDRAQMVADRLRERMQGVDAALGIDGPEAALAAYNAIMANDGLKAEWAKIRDERPELDAQMQDMASQSLNAIVEAQAATVDAPA